jgi:hypothetical protein
MKLAPPCGCKGSIDPLLRLPAPITPPAGTTDGAKLAKGSALVAKAPAAGWGTAREGANESKGLAAAPVGAKDGENAAEPVEGANVAEPVEGANAGPLDGVNAFVPEGVNAEATLADDAVLGPSHVVEGAKSTFEADGVNPAVARLGENADGAKGSLTGAVEAGNDGINGSDPKGSAGNAFGAAFGGVKSMLSRSGGGAEAAFLAPAGGSGRGVSLAPAVDCLRVVGSELFAATPLAKGDTTLLLPAAVEAAAGAAVVRPSLVGRLGFSGGAVVPVVTAPEEKGRVTGADAAAEAAFTGSSSP